MAGDSSITAHKKPLSIWNHEVKNQMTWSEGRSAPSSIKWKRTFPSGFIILNISVSNGAAGKSHALEITITVSIEDESNGSVPENSGHQTTHNV